MTQFRFSDFGWTSKTPGPATFVIGIAVILIAWGYFLALVGPQNPPPSSIATGSAIFLPSIVPIQPKPFDKFLFFGILMGASALLIGTIIVARRFLAPAGDRSPLLLIVCSACAVIAVLSGALHASLALVENGQWFWTAVCVLCAAFFFGKLQDGARTTSFIVISGLVVSAIALAGQRLWTLHNIGYGAGYTSHYDSVAFAVVGETLGGTCLANIIAQYGCHGEFMAPLLHILGTSALAISGLFLIAEIVAVWAAIGFATRIIKTPALLLACVFCILIEAVLNLTPSVYDPILQYYPVRFFFPALSLLVFCWLQRRTDSSRIAITGIFGGAGLCWNLEAGLAVAFAMALFVFVGPLNDPGWRLRNLRNAVLRLSLYIGAVAGAVALFVLYLHLKSGEAIDFRNYVIYQTTFYQTGFGLIPIPPFPDYWTIHAAIILAVLVLAAIAAGSSVERDLNLERAAYLAVLTIGLTLYYTGRSHDLVLRLVAWPDAILLLYLADSCARRGVLRLPLQTKALAGFQIAALALSAAVFVANIPSIWALSDISRLASKDATPMEQDKAFIAARTHAGERVGIVALNQATLYGETRLHVVLKGAGLAELVRRREFEDMQSQILRAGPDKLFLGNGLDISYGMLGADIPFNFAALSRVYALAEWGPAGRLLYLRRKPYSGHDFFADTGPSLTWIGAPPSFAQAWNAKGGGRWGRPNLLRVVIPNAKPFRTFAVRMVVVPEAPQPADAFLISSWCCAPRGFFIRRDAATADGYKVSIGDGVALQASKTFSVPAGQLTDLFVSYDNGALRIFENRKLVIDQKNIGSLAVSGVPLVVGGWYGPDALFQGQIREVEFFNSVAKYP